MELQFRQQHLSISQFDSVVIPDFTILTGLNGAGKTHLLQAMKAGRVAVDSVSINDIAYYSYKDFLVPDSNALTSQQIEQQRASVWSMLTGQIKSGNSQQNWVVQLQSTHAQAFGETDTTELFESGVIWDWEARRHLPPELNSQIEQYTASLKAVFQNGNFKNIPFHQSVIKVFRKLGKAPHSITERDFMDLFAPAADNSRPTHLGGSLGVVFTKYKVSQFLWSHREWESGSLAHTKEALMATFDQRHEKPWKVINEILEGINSHAFEHSVFNFRITDPDLDRLDMDTWQQYQFRPQLIDQNNGQPRPFSALSSGEQVLLALAISIYESRDNFAMPELMLLDEVDSSLHPSMIKALLGTIQDVFVSRGTKVLLATHSPSTVALAPVGSVYVVNKGDTAEKVVAKENSEALEVLTEGYATLQSGLSLFNEISQYERCIVTEGRNINFIQRALEFMGVSGVELVKGLESMTGKEQLKTLYRFFCTARHNKKILFVWDCDVRYQLDQENDVFPLILPKNEANSVARKGIENMFPESLFDHFLNETKNSRGELIREFDPTRKADFETHVLSVGNREDFNGFQVIADKLEEMAG